MTNKIVDLRGGMTFEEKMYHLAVQVGGYKGDKDDLKALDAWYTVNMQKLFWNVVPGLVQAIVRQAPIDSKGNQGGFLVIPNTQHFGEDVELSFDFKDDQFGNTFITAYAYHPKHDQTRPVDLPPFLVSQEQKKGS